MYIVIGFLVLVVVLIVVIQLTSNRKWKLICTVFGYENYFTVIAKLKSEGIKYKTKTPLNSVVKYHFKDSTQYDVWVEKENEQIAHKALHKNN
ncbi:hypothetical protein M3226_15470 [Neobacillus cucumis]|uniref:hypothetical protein n=1 Tax=Neobacillus cucumis TaxID=1740721 RepID=UPI002040A465|nr:hypothetical protein [Neobacillus cucumis]MCM3727080.1 hypothetical protein [Neobacillus cucumis]